MVPVRFLHSVVVASLRRSAASVEPNQCFSHCSGVPLQSAARPIHEEVTIIGACNVGGEFLMIFIEVWL